MLPNDHIADDVSEGAAHLLRLIPPLLHPPTYVRAYFPPLPYIEIKYTFCPYSPFYHRPLSHSFFQRPSPLRIRTYDPITATFSVLMALFESPSPLRILGPN